MEKFGAKIQYYTDMAKLIHRIGAKKLKFNLEVEIHYINITLPDATLLKIRVKRGKDKTEETQVMQYNPKIKRVQFDYPLAFRITMYKKSNKFSKKDISLKLLEIKGKNEVEIGMLKLEFHKFAESGGGIQVQELKLENSIDQNAKVCMSLNVFEEGKSKDHFLTGNVQKTEIINNRRAISISGPIKLDLSNEFVKKNSQEFPEKSDWKSQSEIEQIKQKERKASLKKGFVQTDSHSLLESYESEFTDETMEKPRKPSIKTLRSAFCISEDMIDEIKNEPAELVVDVQENNGQVSPVITDSDSDIDDTEIFYRKTPSDSDKEDEEVLNNCSPDLQSPILPQKLDLSQSPVLNPTFEPTVEEEKTYEKPQTDLPEYLKYENEHGGPEEICSKTSENSSSSDEAPEEVDIKEPEPLPTPITTLKESVPNSSSQELLLNLKEKESGLPDSRNAVCCASCQLF